MCQYFLQKFFLRKAIARMPVGLSEAEPWQGKGFARSPDLRIHQKNVS
ncbi:hypothetical protein [Microcoleus sp. herbarium12]